MTPEARYRQIIHSLVELRKSWDPELHPRVPRGISKGGQFSRKGALFAPLARPALPGDELMSKEERDRYHELEDRLIDKKLLTPEEQEEFDKLSDKFDKWWAFQSDRIADSEKRIKEKEYRDRLKRDAETVAKTLDFDPNDITHTEETLDFNLNDKHMVAGGHVDRGSEKVYLHVNDLRYTDSDGFAGLVAHEIEHAKFNHFLNEYYKQRDQMDKDPRPAPDPNGRYWWQRKGGIIAQPSAGLKSKLNNFVQGDHAQKAFHSAASKVFKQAIYE
jgi:hypothetical protein